MPVRTLLLLAATLAAPPAIAAEATRRIPDRLPSSEYSAVPMPASSASDDALDAPARTGKRVRYTFPAPKRAM
jgi:hypothetical protein